jgi:hypothetical protein
MATYFVNINRQVSNVRVYTIKKHIKGDTNKISKALEAWLQKRLGSGKM